MDIMEVDCDCDQNDQEFVPYHMKRDFNMVNIFTINFAIPEGYRIPVENDYLGGGSYGNVVQSDVICRDGNKRAVAIKKLKDPFMDAIQARRIYREIKLLQLMKHENIIRALDLYTPNKSEEHFRDIYVVTEYAGYSLARVLKQQEEKQTPILEPSQAAFIIYQLLRAVKYLHGATIIHRDLKPGNLAITDDCDLTVLDFGLARSLERTDTGLTQYVMTRWYRSPEVIYWKIGSYSTQADIWSVGCIAAELMTGKPLFTGEDANQQYQTITSIVGSPSPELLQKIERDNGTTMKQVIESYDYQPRRNFRELFAQFRTEWDQDGMKFADFLDKILVLDPEDRLTVDGALQHPYMEIFHDDTDEPVGTMTLDDDAEKSLIQWKSIIWNEVISFTGDEESPLLMN